ncbi:MAG: hypothetical protein QF735_11395, partial [Phycisphaeraceae bacterium]|nr:hypothetical protein [Phycisphaeraceae bacterium]
KVDTLDVDLDLDVQGVTVAPNGSVFAVSNNDNGTSVDEDDDFLELVQLVRDEVTGRIAELVAPVRITSAATGGDIVGVVALEADPATAPEDPTTLFAVGRDPLAATNPDDQRLFVIDADSGLATQVGVLFDTTATAEVADPVTALMFHPDTTLFGVRDTVGGDVLITIDTVGSDLNASMDGQNEVAVNPIGEILAPNEDNTGTIDAVVRSGEFNADGDLIVQDFSLGTAMGRLLQVSTTDPMGATIALSDAGTIDDDLRGYAADARGRLLSFQDQASGTDDLLLINSSELFEIDVLTGMAASQGQVLADDNAVLDDATGVAVSPDGSEVFVVVQDNSGDDNDPTSIDANFLISVDRLTTNGQSRGQVLIDQQNVNVSAIDFTRDGQLIGINEAVFDTDTGTFVARQQLIGIDQLAAGSNSVQIVGADEIANDLTGLTANARGQFLSIAEPGPGQVNDELLISTITQQLFTVDTVVS